MRPAIPTLVLVLALVAPLYAAPPDHCRAGASALGDAKAIAAVRGAIARQCPCATFNGSGGKTHAKFLKCAKAVIKDAFDGTPLFGTYALRRQCKSVVAAIYATSACGYTAAANRVVCCEARPSSGKRRATVMKASKCTSTSNGRVARHACYASPFGVDACTSTGTNECATLVVQETVDIPSGAQPAHTPGSPGVVVTDTNLIAQFGGASFSLNNARYTRYHLAGPAQQPGAILILVPGFEGGAGDFKILAENVIPRALKDNLVVEIWGVDRRTNQLEDMAGLDIAEEFLDPLIALDWLYGAELGFTLHPLLAAGPNRRAVFHDTQADIPFLANWTNLVFSRDIDAVVTAARAVAANQNVFLGGHSAGTGFTARYASTDFNLTGSGPADPGYAKLRGLVLLEGGGGSAGSAGGAILSNDSLDRIEAKFDGGLYGAVRDNAPRCVDGTTACTVATEATDCAGQTPPKCTPPTTSYAVIPGLLNPRVLSAGEVSAIQGVLDPDGGENVVRADQGAPGNNAVAKVPDLMALSFLPRSTAYGGLGAFLDDDGIVATNIASFVATSLGGPGPVVGDIQTWQDITEGPLPAALTPNNGPQPTALPGSRWGQEKEVTRFDRMITTFYKGGTGFTDLYYPVAGPSVTSALGVCTAGTCTAGDVGATCADDTGCGQSVNLDSTALSVGRGRRDIENLTQVHAIDIPVLAVGGSNGLAVVPGVYVPFGTSIGTCTAPSCDGTTPRVVDAASPNPAFPTFGGTAGGYEVVMAEGFAHIDVVTAEDNDDNPVPKALVAFLKRNVQ